MEEYLDFVTIDFWTMVFTWLNFIILFLLLRHFLFKPVNRVLSERAEEIENTYKIAETAQHDAEMAREKYENRLNEAKTEADGIIQSAVSKARERSDSIISEAQENARHIAEKSQKQTELDRQNAMKEARQDIAGMAVDVAEKLIGERLDSGADEKLIESIIDQI